MALAALRALRALDAEHRSIYYDLVFGSLNEETRKTVEQELEMQTHKKYEYKTEFARTYIAQGRAQGKAEGEAQALLAVLAARGLEIDAATRERIVACTDPEKLERWIVRAATASKLQDVLFDL